MEDRWEKRGRMGEKEGENRGRGRKGKEEERRVLEGYREGRERKKRTEEEYSIRYNENSIIIVIRIR